MTGAAYCPLCSATAADRDGTLKHEGWCPLFMRGPEAGGDPHEWPTLLDGPAETVADLTEPQQRVWRSAFYPS